MKNTVLVVEDNPITRKMVAYTLTSEGYAVKEAGSGRAALALTDPMPDLFLLDYVLPDMDGLHLLAALRSLAGGADVPAAVITGMVSQLDEMRSRIAGPTTFLPKPIEPERILEFVRSHLERQSSAVGAGKRVLVVDDEQIGRKLTATCLKNAGFSVETAASGAEALEMARASPPDAILSDVLMPEMDGFLLCRAVRSDPGLSGVPVILLSSAYADIHDQKLAKQMGANALLPRNGELEDAIKALTDAMGDGATPELGADDWSALHVDRMRAQLGKQMMQNETLLRQSAIQAAVLSVVRGLTEALSQPDDLPQMLADVLVHCLDAAGLSSGVLYLPLPDGQLRLQAQSGLVSAVRDEAVACFGHPELLQRALSEARPTPFFVGDPAASVEAQDFLARLGQRSALVIPFVAQEKRLGIMILASGSQDLSNSSWMGFASALGTQFGQTIALGHYLSKGASTEKRYQALMGGAHDAILILDDGFSVLEANRAAAALFGYEKAVEMTGLAYSQLVAPEEGAAALQTRTSPIGRVQECRIVRSDGARVFADISFSPVRFGDERTTIVILRDTTERKLAVEELRASEESLRRSQTLLHIAGRVARIGAWALDLPEMRLTWSDQVRVIHEAPPDYVPLLREAINSYAPEHRDSIREAVELCMRDGTPFDLDRQIITAKGRRVWVRVIGEAERDPSGAIHRVHGALQDVSDSKRIEEVLREGTVTLEKSVREREALLKEVHHRVKNNLQIITSLLRLEGGRAKDMASRQPLKAMQNRILAMAVMHETLYRSGNFAEIDVGSYINEVAGQLHRSLPAEAGRVSIHRDLAQAFVSLDQSVPCGLIISELITNALTHGFPEGRSGEVRVTLRRVGETQVLLSVSDDGVGLPPDLTARIQSALGLQLVSDLARQLRGELTIGPGPEAVFEVLFTPERQRPIDPPRPPGGHSA